LSLVEIKNILEIIYYISGIVLCTGVVIGIKQIKVAKDEFKLLNKDYEVRNKRASIEKSIEYLNMFATEFIPDAGSLNRELKKLNVKQYNGPKNKDFIFCDSCNLGVKYVKDNLIASHKNGAVSILNKFEFFSAALISGLADEELAFKPLAKLFCDFLEGILYIPLCYARKDDKLASSYSYTVKLYQIWKPRLEKEQLEKSMSKLDEQISKITDERIQSIGSQ
jgi:hypothetical protein